MGRRLVKKLGVTEKQAKDEVASVVASAKIETERLENRQSELIKNISELQKSIKDEHLRLSESKKVTGLAVKEQNKSERRRDTLKSDIYELETTYKKGVQELEGVSEELKETQESLQSTKRDLVATTHALKAKNKQILSAKNKVLQANKDTELVRKTKDEYELAINSLIQHISELENERSITSTKLKEDRERYDVYIKDIADKKEVLQEEIIGLNKDIEYKGVKLKELEASTMGQKGELRVEKDELDKKITHNRRLLKELDVKIKQVKSFKEDKITQEYLTNNGL